MTGHIEPVVVLQGFSGSDSTGSDHMNKWGNRTANLPELWTSRKLL
jgi:hypothetical protein